MDRIETEPRLQFEVIRPAEPRVRAAQALACSRSLAFDAAEPVPVGSVGGVDLGEGLAGGRLPGRRRGDLGAKGVAFLGQRPFALAQGGEVGIGARHALLGEGRGRLGSNPPVLGIAARGIADTGLVGKPVAARSQLRGSSLPGRQRGPGL